MHLSALYIESVLISFLPIPHDLAFLGTFSCISFNVNPELINPG